MNAVAGPAEPVADASSGKTRADENFPVGSALIAPRLRPHVHAYYAFARAADDIADNAVLPAAEKLARLDAMEALLLGRPTAPDGAGRGEAASAVRLRASLAETGISPARGTDLLVAFRQDAVKQRYKTWEELVEYCRHSANPVGAYLLDLHGEGPGSHPGSNALCTALQVLNHLQDCRDDLETLDRCYLPRDWLEQAGEDVDAVRWERTGPGLRRVLDRCLHEVDRLNRVASSLPGAIRDRRMRLEAAVIVALSHRLARRLRREDPLAGRVRLRRGDAARSLLAALRHLR